MNKRQRLLWPIHAMLIGLVIICVISMGKYIHNYYHATAQAQAVLEHPEVTVEQINSRTLAFIPEQPKAALIFYPGGKVEYTAYAPLMQELSKQGFLCLLEKMPVNLAGHHGGGWTAREVSGHREMVHRRSFSGRIYGGHLCIQTRRSIGRIGLARGLFHGGLTANQTENTVHLWQ